MSAPLTDPAGLIPSIEEQENAQVRSQTQAFQARQQAVNLINKSAPFRKGSEKQLFPSMAAPVEQPDPLEMRMSMTPTNTNHISGTDVVNFLFGDEMGILGIKQDNEGFHWEWEIAKDQWANEPLWVNLLAATSLIGSAAFPAAKAAHSATKFGKIGAALGKFGDRAVEINKFKELNMIDKGAKDVSDSTLKVLRMQENQLSSYNKMSAMVDAEARGALNITGWEKAKWEFNKRFANQYFRITNDLVENTGFRKTYMESLDKLWKAEDIGKVLAAVPDIDAGDDIVKYWIHNMRPDVISKAPKLNAQQKQWADDMAVRMRKHQDEAIEDGMLPESVRDTVGDMHIPAQFKGTPAPDVDLTRSYLAPIRSKKPKEGPPTLVGKDKPRTGLKKFLLGPTESVIEKQAGDPRIAVSTYKFPRLDSPTLKQRKATLPEVAERLESGKLITDPAELTVRGYMTDRMLLQNFRVLRDIALNDSYATSADDIARLYGGDAAKAAKAGFISLENHMPKGARSSLRRMIEKKGGTLGPNKELPWIRKDVFEEMFGESGSFSQIQSATDLLEVITTMYKTAKTGHSIPTHFQNLGGSFVFLAQAGFNPLAPKNLDLMIKSSQAFNKISNFHAAAKKAGGSTREILDNAKINLGKIDINGKKFDLNDELLDPAVRELIEESTFELVEGSGHLETLLKQLRTEQRLSRGAIKAYQKAKNLLQVGDRVKWMDNMTKAYMAEDMVPKMSLYLKLRGDGLSKSAAVLETARRLPMYSTVGSSIKQGRRWVFPWATFPAEALRITKNNVMDHPLRMIPWFQTTNIAQSLFSSVGLAPQSPEEVEEATQSLPLWAQRSVTVATTGEGAALGGGALTGGIAGGVAGGLRAGPVGALAGAAIGSVGAAAGLQALSTEQASDNLRGLVLDWLPHSSFMLTSNSPDMFGQYAPFQDIQGAMEQTPVEPFAILKPIINIMAGQTGFGTPIGAEGPADAFGKMLSGFIGLIAPPWVQKYGFKETTPDISFSEHVTGSPFPGDISNVSRLLIDTGTAIDPNTGKAGSLSHDFLLKNLGMGKSWSAHGAVALSNETETEKHMSKVRNYLSRQLSYYSANGKEDRLMKVLTDVMSTFTKQYASNPMEAQKKYGEWVESKLDQLGQFPRLRNWSQEEMLNRLRKATTFNSQIRGQARQEIVNTLQQQLQLKRLRSRGSSQRGIKRGGDRGVSRGRSA